MNSAYAFLEGCLSRTKVGSFETFDEFLIQPHCRMASFFVATNSKRINNVFLWQTAVASKKAELRKFEPVTLQKATFRPPDWLKEISAR